ncbi:MAG: tRNA pseudouridine(55) synthase TruB [Simkaniaceae bacterium]|nr:tRNA pseudouridine(55) synthase TruB [Simkaniaceae bacterium]
MNPSLQGILPVNKEKGRTAFYPVKLLRRLSGIRKVGHAGILDPFATGVMVMLIGRKYTRRAHTFLNEDKEYVADIFIGTSTDTYDRCGTVTASCDRVPSPREVSDAIERFQGWIQQVPPMYSAKKIGGQKLHVLARQGVVLERKPSKIRLALTILDYTYPRLVLRVRSSKGAYMRSLAHDIGQTLSTEAHLFELTRTRSGRFTLEQCIDQAKLTDPGCDLTGYLCREV